MMFGRNRAHSQFGGRGLVIIIGALLVLLLLTIFSIRNPLTYHPALKRTITLTDITAGQNFGYLSGTDLYAYNGMAFYKINTATSKLMSLSSGQRLPVVDKMYWANSHGALMTFKASFGQTQVDQILRSSGKLFESGVGSYAWYLDFSTGKIRLVETTPIGEVSYSEKESGFYYTASPADTSNNPLGTELHFYNFKTRQNQLLSKDIELRSVTAIQTCGSVAQLCIIGRDKYDQTAAQKLYGFNAGKQIQRIFNSKGVLQPTANPTIFMSFPETEVKSSDQTDSVDGSDSVEKAYVYDAAAKSLTPLGFSIASAETAIDFSDPKQAYILGNTATSAKTNSYQSIALGKKNQFTHKAEPLQYGNGKLYTGNVLGLTGSDTGKTSLLKTAEGRQILFSNVEGLKPILAEARGDAEASIKKCLSDSGGLRTEYLSSVRTFNIFFTDDGGFASNVTSFSNCMKRTDLVAMVGYNYTFATISPDNGYLTSD